MALPYNSNHLYFSWNVKIWIVEIAINRSLRGRQFDERNVLGVPAEHLNNEKQF